MSWGSEFLIQITYPTQDLFFTFGDFHDISFWTEDSDYTGIYQNISAVQQRLYARALTQIRGETGGKYTQLTIMGTVEDAC